MRTVDPSKRRVLRSWLVLTGIALFVGLISLHQIYSLDYWTHLAFGQQFVAQGTTQIAEPFLRFSTDAFIDNTAWPFQVFVFTVHQIGSDEFVSLVIAAAAALTAVPLLRIAADGLDHPLFPYFVVLVCGSMWLANLRFLPRPEVLVYPLLALSLYLCRAWVNRPRASLLLALLVIFLAWKPLHVTWAIGFLFVSIYLVLNTPASTIRVLFSDTRSRVISVVVAGFAVAGLAGSAGFAWEVIEGLQSGGRMAEITEMRPTWEFPHYLPEYLGASLLCGLLAWGGRANRIRRMLFWFAAALLGLVVIRNMAFALVVMLFVSAEGLLSVSEEPFDRIPSGLTQGVAVMLLCWIAVIAFSSSDPRWGVGIAPVQHALGAADFVQANRPNAVVFNDFDRGGSLNWVWGGRIKTFIDGRALGGPQVLRAHDDLLELRNPVSILDRYAIDTIVIGAVYLNNARLYPVVAYLVSDPGWRLVYARDGLVFVRSPLSPGISALPQREAWQFVLRELDSIALLDGTPEHLDYSYATARYLLGDWNTARVHLGRAIEQHPDLLGSYRWLERRLE